LIFQSVTLIFGFGEVRLEVGEFLAVLFRLLGGGEEVIDFMKSRIPCCPRLTPGRENLGDRIQESGVRIKGLPDWRPIRNLTGGFSSDS